MDGRWRRKMPADGVGGVDLNGEDPGVRRSFLRYAALTPRSPGQGMSAFYTRGVPDFSAGLSGESCDTSFRLSGRQCSVTFRNLGATGSASAVQVACVPRKH